MNTPVYSNQFLLLDPRTMDLAPVTLEHILSKASLAELGFFVGAGISREAPTSIPTGQELRKAIFSFLASASGVVLPDLSQLSSHIPEMVLEILDRTFPGSMGHCLSLLNGGPPNLRHKCLAELGKYGTVSTVNFDTKIEEAAHSNV
ncbi:MAG: hypothetical protein WA672_02805, partial [Candidatus Angelobacter sp.]